MGSVAGEAVKWLIISGAVIGGGYLLLKWIGNPADWFFGDKGVLPQAFDFFTQGVLPWAGKAAADAGKWAGGAAQDVGSWVGGAAKDVSKTVNDVTMPLGKLIDKRTKEVGKGINTTVGTIGRDVSNLFKGIKL